MICQCPAPCLGRLFASIARHKKGRGPQNREEADDSCANPRWNPCAPPCGGFFVAGRESGAMGEELTALDLAALWFGLALFASLARSIARFTALAEIIVAPRGMALASLSAPGRSAPRAWIKSSPAPAPSCSRSRRAELDPAYSVRKEGGDRGRHASLLLPSSAAGGRLYLLAWDCARAGSPASPCHDSSRWLCGVLEYGFNRRSMARPFSPLLHHRPRTVLALGFMFAPFDYSLHLAGVASPSSPSCHVDDDLFKRHGDSLGVGGEIPDLPVRARRTRQLGRERSRAAAYVLGMLLAGRSAAISTDQPPAHAHARLMTPFYSFARLVRVVSAFMLPRRLSFSCGHKVAPNAWCLSVTRFYGSRKRRGCIRR